MFESPRYIQNSFSVTMERQSEIRRRANDFEDLLKAKIEGHYGQPQVVPVPDELDPEVPRLIFGSRHGFSQILISQISITLSVNYSPEWQHDILKGQEYLLDRTKAIFSLFELMNDVPLFFSGLTTRVRIASTEADSAIIARVKQLYGIGSQSSNIHDLMFKLTNVYKDRFFNNMTVQNYRVWKLVAQPQGVLRLPLKEVGERGVEIINDFNDRYAFNENVDYYSSPDNVKEIIASGFAETKKIILEIMGGQK
ncbi:MAG TPA: hypothetical protein ENI27_07955 [bacterium]|nr:hypothetical protein [bacterium]